MIRARVNRLLQPFRRGAVSVRSGPPPEPIREEIFGPDRLRIEARRFAASHRLERRPRRGVPVLARLEENERVLRETYRELALAVRRQEAISPAAEWLLDNFHVIEGQVHEARESLPEGYQRELPKLTRGDLRDHPRVFGIAWDYVAHTDSRFDPEALNSFVEAYQEAAPLTIGELWAVPSALRLVLVENLARLAERIMLGRAARTEARKVAAAVRAAARTDGARAPDPLRPYDRLDVEADRAFVVELVQWLREEDPTGLAAVGWLEERMGLVGVSPETLVREEHASQLSAQATVENIITSMRKISAFAWAEFFESVSLVERTLRRDASGVYGRTDFATRDQYRHAVEELAKRSGMDEEEVARQVVARAARARERRTRDEWGQPPGALHEPRDGYVGYHLLFEGRRAFERELGYRAPLSMQLYRLFVAGAYPGYFGAMALLTVMLLSLPLVYAATVGAAAWELLVVGLAALVPATELAIAVLHQDVTELVPPRRLPKLELGEGVPAHLKTLVGVPTLLGSEEEIREQVDRLEERFLANSGGHLVFALLTDWVDAPRESMPEDERLLATAAAAVSGLNRRYGAAPDGHSRFLLLHRRRIWSESEQRWMGWDRKRGKLEELNRILRGARDTTYLLRDDELTDVAQDIRFVLTLDADTRLPPGAARRLVGAAGHPLNRARFNKAAGRVTEGYGILQPRITAVLPNAGKGSLYHRMYSGASGIDPYSSASSDLYQDLFGEGTFVGKGIYDVDAFRASLEGRLGEVTLLSHDHFEGAFARCGLVSDIELFDDFPTHYEINARRVHRWARGDWQLLPWVLGRGPKVAGRDVPRTPPFLSWWKMVDNLRRTLAIPSGLALLFAGWLLVPVSPLIWAGFVVATIAAPAAVPVGGTLLPRRWRASLRSRFRGMRREAWATAVRVAMEVAFLANHAWLMVDALLRSLTRVYVTHRNLLEWTPAALDGGVGGGVRGSYRRLWRPVAMAVGTVAIVAALQPSALAAALPLAGAWAASPLLAWWLSLPIRAADPRELSAEDRRELRRTARESWRYFEETVGEGENWLPPDNIQEDPELRIAHRTSPTNVGVYLLSVVAARDFGWIGTREAAERLEQTLGTVERLERLRGHLFNWYETRSLLPLEPPYISTVDSGNLAGHLMVMAAAAREFRKRPLGHRDAADGILDAVAQVRRAVDRAPERFRGGTVPRRDLDESLRRLEERLDAVPDRVEQWGYLLAELEEEARELDDMTGVVAERAGCVAGRSLRFWTGAVRRAIESHRRDLAALDPNAGEGLELERSLRLLAGRADALAQQMDFSLLYDPMRKLFSIGYRPADDHLDEGYYDLLASEARVASLVAVATGDVPAEHWFHLGRASTPLRGGAALVSWSGSMFEYLMPYLIMDQPPETILARTQRLIVRRQVEYGKERGVPWGVSESAYNGRDIELTYQYSHFGVPGLGLVRGLSEDLVVAPYATALAAMVAPQQAVDNLRRLDELGARGKYGFYEAVDFSPERLSTDEHHAVVRAHMAHHQGMTVAALANVLFDGRLRRRFHRLPMVRSVDVLLQERVPRDIEISLPRREEVETVRHVRETVPPVARRFTSPHRHPPATHLLSNGRYSVMLTAAGAGYSHWKGLAVTRWREDPTRDHWGSFIYLRDVDSSELWSAGWQPTAVEPDSYEVLFSEDRAELRRRDGAISTIMEVLVSPEEDGELRRITLRNHESRVRHVEVTSYAEVVLLPPATDDAHPAFHKLFVQTEFDPSSGALLATRRRRSADDLEVWAGHVATVEGETVGALLYETDRARFLDRGRGPQAPASVVEGRPLSNTTGPVLDPVFSLRRTLRIRPGQSARITFATLVAETRAQVLNWAEVQRDPSAFQRAAGLAWTQAQVQLQHLGVSPDEAHLFQRLSSRVLYLDPGFRPSPERLARKRKGQRALWRYGISGDRPIVLVRIAQVRDRELVRQILRAHEYWSWKGLEADLVILNEHPVTYADELQSWIQRVVRVSRMSLGEEHRAHGDVFVLRSEELDPEDRDLLGATARVALHARNGSLSEQLESVQGGERQSPPPRPPRPDVVPDAPPMRRRLLFYNGLGGFSEDGQYVITLGEGQWTPAPWCNVVANRRFGFLVSEAGSGFTWSENSGENRLTPWSNDPVQDPPGEAFYVRDEVTGDVWSPTPLPIREATQYRITHSQGWSRFEHDSHGIALELMQFVPPDDPLKISRLRLRNESGRTRRLSVTAYAEWVLGALRARSAPHVITEVDASTGALFTRNGWGHDLAGRVAFADLAGEQEAWTADRTEFLGRHGSLDFPAALARGVDLSGTVGAALDPCVVLRRTLVIPSGGEAEVVFLLGQGTDTTEARALVERYRDANLDETLNAVRTWWDDVLGTVQVEVPDRSMEPMLNRWLLYQTLSCRLFGRSAFYQSGGAYGFRDQLQDVMALTMARRDLARAHILRAAGHQFPEGDVLHWWHPPSGRGVRTRISDDLLWLPFAVVHYLDVTGDETLLEEEVHFLDGSPLEDDEEERYFEPERSAQSGTLFEHCGRALDARLDTGPHGLPLMGTGDWNDGMNRVGHKGRGESVWMGWFLYMALRGFAPLAEVRGERQRAERWRRHMDALAEALERAGWDGAWYRRAYFDDGTPLGSSANDECRIDSIAQSWAVLSGVAQQGRQVRAMQAVEQYLVRRGDALVLLFTPPFDHGSLDPGYIKGYLPGVRENGGQYTHAAIWSVLGFAELGQGDEAVELFSILNPINQAGTRAGVHRYKVEPYVTVGDVYAEAPHAGRGGWTWYTGSAGWMYRAGVEWILGFRLRGDKLRIDPCIPRDWPRYRILFRYHSARYEIDVESPGGAMRGVVRAELDDRVAERERNEAATPPTEDGPDAMYASPRVDAKGAWIPLADDGRTHRVRIVLGGD